MEGFLGKIALIIIGQLVRGFALTMLWRWFVMPLGAPDINYVWALGLCTTYMALQRPPPMPPEVLKALQPATPSAQNPSPEPSATMAQRAGVQIGYGLACLAFGWVVHEIMVRL